MTETNDSTAWFEQLYAAAAAGEMQVPWDRGTPAVPLVEWAEREGLSGVTADGQTRTAMVVGAGYGRDSEYVASLGFRTTASDIAPTAVRDTKARFPDSRVDYVVADLFDLPEQWRGAFDLVVEDMNVQALPESVRPQATQGVASLVAPGGTLVVIMVARDEGVVVDGPPWPFTAGQLDGFGAGGLTTVTRERLPSASAPGVSIWREVLRRPREN
ncbi:class I SAM-dependent methyltransferase [Knoellia koreensis]|uniref:Class I SAM-dependent methyltransferase n=1 Tax=Knoellia koreensis TaxID=2730921 RepID=A0A849HEK2_9MICO|nr:class I SAM-dependent methyltransferase [Knoellia sp. DB2414S]NNM45702.1 class I SAM-dependent methyltransferase [Knoellia sp. DB2414S]